jgi:hypothetical protein
MFSSLAPRNSSTVVTCEAVNGEAQQGEWGDWRTLCYWWDSQAMGVGGKHTWGKRVSHLAS